MSEYDKGYFARRAAEEAELALATEDPDAQAAHRRLQRAYIERASVGARPGTADQSPVGDRPGLAQQPAA